MHNEVLRNPLEHISMNKYKEIISKQIHVFSDW